MNIVADNAYTRDLEKLGTALAKPRAVLVVSAHWMTHGFFVGSDETNVTIHDFYGFPDELYQKRYPAPGAPDVAQRVVELTGGVVQAAERGLDHAAWAPLIRVWPEADVPVLELSLDLAEPAADHYALGRLLAPLRDEGVLLMGSGNIVHNLQAIDWDEDAAPFDWAVEFDAFVADAVAERRHQDLVDYLRHPLGRMAAPDAGPLPAAALRPRRPRRGRARDDAARRHPARQRLDALPAGRLKVARAARAGATNVYASAMRRR